ncbi:hypothetical protein D1953_19630 [Peribacillus asahii]|uniref:Sucrose phosphatase-like domain-containing protein n=1 Tax=Peribacillus asahii TaxID=228899 RepID=A0A398AXM1_9BACI|nr:HAD family hydrolase [Peribacillus asahii]RID81804.1 hypothetical protein D1953_19630 [Peribacillus asahii]
MILFTSDLDRTLIYSERMMTEYPIESETACVEMMDERSITFMSYQSIKLLSTFHENHLFVPVTTRALHLYKRIYLFQNDIKPPFAVTSNGGTILIDGVVDQDWHQELYARIVRTSLPKEDMLQAFAAIRHESWVLRESYVDDLFYVFQIVKEAVPYDELAAFEVELKKIGWRTFLHGRKLYILPQQVDKAFAVQRVKEYIDDYEVHVAAGDSFMDYLMMKEADIGYSPLHGEIFETMPSAPKVTWLNGRGVAFTEELLMKLLESKTTLIR